MNGSVTYTLKHPVELRNAESGEVAEVIKTLTLVRPRGKHMKAMDGAKGEMGKTLALLSAISAQPPSTMDLLDGEDLTKLGEIVQDFFGVPPPTGGM